MCFCSLLKFQVSYLGNFQIYLHTGGFAWSKSGTEHCPGHLLMNSTGHSVTGQCLSIVTHRTWFQLYCLSFYPDFTLICLSLKWYTAQIRVISYASCKRIKIYSSSFKSYSISAMLLLLYSLTTSVAGDNTFARNSIMSSLDLRYSLCSLLASVTHTVIHGMQLGYRKKLSRDLNVKFQYAQ